MIVVPATGNTIAKLANDIIDTPATMAVKSHLRNNNSLVIAVSTNNGLGNNASNIGNLLNTKNIFFVPFGQDDYVNKENSLIADFTQICDAVNCSLKGQQIQPLLI